MAEVRVAGVQTVLRSALKLVTSTAHLCQLFMLLCTFSKYCWTVAKLWLRCLTCDQPAEHFLEQKSLLLLATRSGTGNWQLRTANSELGMESSSRQIHMRISSMYPNSSSNFDCNLATLVDRCGSHCASQTTVATKWLAGGGGKEKEKGNQLPSPSLMSSGKTNFYDFSN